MARAQATDFYHTHKFQVIDDGGAGTKFLNTPAGFNTLTIPEYTLDVVEYKEGIWTYRRKFPGDVTVSDVSFTRGVMKKDTDFFKWVVACIEGKEYRTDMTIRHLHRDDVSGLGTKDYSEVAGKRIIKLYEAMPIRVKLGTDFDSMSAEVSIQEMDVAVEHIDITDSN
jgi:phage tail-like protein